MIDKSKTYKTRDGREVRIYATDGGGIKCVHGAYYDDRTGNWVPLSWTDDGKVDTYSSFREPFDLIEVRPRHQRTVWLNVYDRRVSSYDRKQDADQVTYPDRIACIKVDLDFEEGEGV